MADYADIYGKRVKVFDSDPTLDSSYEGQVWYNSATGTLKSVVAFAAWRSSTNAPFKAVAAGATGPQTANLVFGGYGNPATPSGITTTAEYNGLGWTAGGAMGDGRNYIGSAGTQTAGLGFGGLDSPPRSAKTEEYNGTSWSEQNDLSNARGQGVGTGSQTAGMYTTGDAGPPDYSVYVENYDGTSWTNGTSNSLGRRVGSGNGSQTSAIIIAGNINPSDTLTALTEEWNGSSWSSGGSVNTARKGGMAAGANADSSVFFGGTAAPGVSTATEDYDGSTWATSSATMSVGVTDNQQGGGSTINTAAIVVGGSPDYTQTQEYNKSINTITAAAWASGGNLGTARRQVGGFGHTTTTAVCACGQNPPGLSNVEEYNGSSWSEVNNAPMARVKPFACGVLTAGLIGGGEEGPSPASYQSSAEYDGTNWTASPSSALGQNVNSGTALGIQTAALLVVGSESPNTAVKYYDGSSWTAGPAATPTSMASASGNGTQTNGLVYGNSPSQTTTLEWDGSSWTSGGALTSGRDRGAEAVGAPSTAALYFGGNNPSSTELTATEGYDGTSWSSRPSMATARRGLGGAGIQTAALAFAGYTGSDTAVSEEFTASTETVTAKTLTTS